MSSSAVVVGASLAGLFTAAALAGSGRRVTVVERDRLEDVAIARRGVPQGGQAHLVLMRGWQAAEALLPGLRQDLIASGAARFASGQMPWLGEYGWLPANRFGAELVTATRPLLELCVRRRVERLPGVQIITGRTVAGLEPVAGRWRVAGEVADLVVDASGRGSRLPAWLADLGYAVPQPELVDARLGYATRLYRPRRPLPLRTGVVVGATVDTPSGGLALPVEQGRWLLMGGGYGDLRPPRSAAGFTDFLARLRDPVLADLEAQLEPLGEVAVHRQTGNRRHRFEHVPDWPEGILVVGDAAAAFNPVFGQGISVAAAQAQVLGDALRRGARPDRRLQRRLSQVADLPWDIATGADRRQLKDDHRPSVPERLVGAWTERLGRSAASGDVAAMVVFDRLYHLTAPGSTLFHPLLIGGVLRSFVSPPPTRPRPDALSAIPARPVRVSAHYSSTAESGGPSSIRTASMVSASAAGLSSR